MPPFGTETEDDEDLGDDIRSELQAAFGQFDAGELTEANASTLELKPARERSTETPSKSERPQGEQSGSRQAGASQQQSIGKADTPAATGGQAPSSGESRPRNADGTFAKAPEQPASPGPGAQQQPAAQTPANEKPQAPQTTAPDPSRPAAPASLSDAGRAAWDTLHPEIRQHMADREQHYQAQQQDYLQALRPVEESARRLGIDWKEGLGRLMNAQQRLDQNPHAALLWLAQAYDVNIDDLADMAAGVAQPPANPNQQTPGVPPAWDHRLSSIEQTLQQQQQAQQAAQQAEQQSRRDAIQREFNTFASSPAAPHWERVKSDVYAFVPYVRSQMPDAPVGEVIKAAYERAAWAHPEVRALLQEEQRQAADAQRRQKNGERTQLARAAQIVTSHRGAPAPAAPANANGSLRDEISANWAAWESARA